MRHTEETRRKLSEQRTGAANPFYGRTHTEESKRRISAGGRGKGTGRIILDPRKIRIPTEPDLSYLAGIVDGEGSIRFRKGRPFVAVYNTSEALMNWLIEKVGGTAKPGDKRGRLPCWTWQVGAARDVQALCAALAPRLVVKRREAEGHVAFLTERYGVSDV